MEIGQSQSLLGVSCGLFYLQSSVNQHLSNQMIQMPGRRHPTCYLLTEKVIITYLTYFLSFFNISFILFFFFNGHVTCMWDLSFLDKDWAHVPCIGNTVLTTELPGKCRILQFSNYIFVFLCSPILPHPFKILTPSKTMQPYPQALADLAGVNCNGEGKLNSLVDRVSLGRRCKKEE